MFFLGLVLVFSVKNVKLSLVLLVKLVVLNVFFFLLYVQLWSAILFFLVYVGGLMVLLFYVLSLFPNPIKVSFLSSPLLWCFLVFGGLVFEVVFVGGLVGKGFEREGRKNNLYTSETGVGAGLVVLFLFLLLWFLCKLTVNSWVCLRPFF